MGDHASVVASSSFQVPPHAIVIADNASQANAWNSVQASNAASAPQPMSWEVPLCASLAVGGALVLSAYGIDHFTRSHAKKQFCYRDAAELMTDNQIRYSDAQIRSTLLRLCIEKFKHEGSVKRKLSRGLDTYAVSGHAQESVRKSMKCGLSPKKMERLLNDQVQVLRGRYDRAMHRDESYECEHLRPIQAYGTEHSDLAHLPTAELFPCPDVKRFTVLYFNDLKVGRSLKNHGLAHYDVLEHHENTWTIRYKNKPRKTLVEARATAEGAKQALNAFAQQKHGTTNNVKMTIFRQILTR